MQALSEDANRPHGGATTTANAVVAAEADHVDGHVVDQTLTGDSPLKDTVANVSQGTDDVFEELSHVTQLMTTPDVDR